jgi:hypothetical protein
MGGVSSWGNPSKFPAFALGSAGQLTEVLAASGIGESWAVTRPASASFDQVVQGVGLALTVGDVVALFD